MTFGQRFVVAATFAFILPFSAHCTVVQGVLTGVLRPLGGQYGANLDGLGLFGPAGASLAGQAISVFYSYDTGNLRYSVALSGDSCPQGYVPGGTYIQYVCTEYIDEGYTLPPYQPNVISVTINGVTVTSGSPSPPFFYRFYDDDVQFLHSPTPQYSDLFREDAFRGYPDIDFEVAVNPGSSITPLAPFANKPGGYVRLFPNNRDVVELEFDVTPCTGSCTPPVLTPPIPIAVAPIFTPPPGTFSTTQTVSIADTTPGVSIYYTTDGTTPTTSSPLYIEPITISKSQTVQAIAAAPGYTNSNVATATYTILSPPPPATILDPVPDLLDGPQITTDPSTLASGGRSVSGIAADGIAQLVFRAPAQAAGDTVTATLLSDQCTDPSTPSTCGPSTSSDNDGGLFTPGTPVTSSSVLPNNATGTVDTTSKDAFIAYRAPVDFNRPSQDETASSRYVYVQFSYSSANSATPYYVSTPVPITIIRPPVVLIHGYASDAAETWKYFVANTVSDPRFRMFEVNYGDFIDVKSTTPTLGPFSNYLCKLFNDCVTHFRQSDLGFTTSATQTPRVLPDKAVSDQTIDFIANFDAGSNPLGKPVAGIRADVIGHSMGGLIARQWSSQQSDYYTDASFGQGYIHKMITLGTPHLGSPFGTLGLQPDSTCFRNLSAGNFIKDLVVPERILISSAVLDDGTKDGELVGGAVGELAGDGIDTKGMSPALQFLQTNGSSIPTAKIAGTIGDISRSKARTAFLAIHHYCSKKDPLAYRFTPERYSTIFDPDVFVPRTPEQAGNPEGSSKETFNDGAVPLTSALANPAQASAACDNAFRFCGYAHGENTQTLTGADYNLVHDNGLILNRIQQLLNLPVTITGVWGPQ